MDRAGGGGRELEGLEGGVTGGAGDKGYELHPPRLAGDVNT